MNTKELSKQDRDLINKYLAKFEDTRLRVDKTILQTCIEIGFELRDQNYSKGDARKITRLINLTRIASL